MYESKEILKIQFYLKYYHFRGELFTNFNLIVYITSIENETISVNFYKNVN